MNRLTRDTVIILFALGACAYEIVLGGARPAVLTFIAGLLASPLIIRSDEARRSHNHKDEP